MTTASVPASLRGSLAESKAHEQGYAFASGGLSRDTNPYAPFGDERPLCVAWDEGWSDFHDEQGESE